MTSHLAGAILAGMPRTRTAGTWTAEQAHEMALRSVAARKLRKSRRPLPGAQPPPLEPLIDFPAELQASVRARVRDILAGLADETAKARIDGAQVDRLCSALERLADLERILDGRPLPGSRRPPREDPPSARRPASERRGPAVPMAPPAQPQPSDPPLADDDEPEPPRFTPAEL